MVTGSSVSSVAHKLCVCAGLSLWKILPFWNTVNVTVKMVSRLYTMTVLLQVRIRTSPDQGINTINVCRPEGLV